MKSLQGRGGRRQGTSLYLLELGRQPRVIPVNINNNKSNYFKALKGQDHQKAFKGLASVQCKKCGHVGAIGVSPMLTVKACLLSSRLAQIPLALAQSDKKSAKRRIFAALLTVLSSSLLDQMGHNFGNRITISIYGHMKQLTLIGCLRESCRSHLYRMVFP